MDLYNKYQNNVLGVITDARYPRGGVVDPMAGIKSVSYTHLDVYKRQGATWANVLAFNEVADEVVMLDVKEGVSEGKAMDMMQTAQLWGFDRCV